MKVINKVLINTCALVLASNIFAADIGVIPDNKCPANSESISIYMDDEDSENNSTLTGWVGATEGGTKFKFCRVDGDMYEPLSNNEGYAVLKLDDTCPSGSIEFNRFFDNEDNNTNNQVSGNIYPNIVKHNTDLKFCYFKGNSNGMDSFPDIGVEYGVFAPKNFSKSLAGGTIHTDDEDKNNANKLNVHGYDEIKDIIHGGGNTDLYVHKVITQVSKPTVTRIHPVDISENSVKIFWDVSDFATGQVEYGKTGEYGSFNKKETSFDYNHHEQKLKGLEPNTTYHYRVISEDANGQKVVSDDHTFKTLGSGLTVTNIMPVGVTKNSAKIFWDVSDYATGQVEYGETTAYSSFSKKETSFDYKHHEQLLRNLKPNTTYHYRVISEDIDGQKTVSSDNSFKTKVLGGGKELILSQSTKWTYLYPKYFAKNAAYINSLPFSGFIMIGDTYTNKFMDGHTSVSYEAIWNEVKMVKGLFPNKSNFLKIRMLFPGKGFWDDKAWNIVIANFKTLAKVAKNLGFRGIAYDNEAYNDNAEKMINYKHSNEDSGYKDPDPKRTFQKHIAKITEWHKKIMEAMVSEYPSIDVLFYHSPVAGHIKATDIGIIGSNNKSHPVVAHSKERFHEMVGAMFVGLKKGLSHQATLHDMGEDYRLRTEKHFDDVYKWRKHTIASDATNSGVDETQHWVVPQEERASWEEEVYVDFMVSNLPEDDEAYKEFNTTDKVGLEDMKTTLERALTRSDKYVIFYSRSKSEKKVKYPLPKVKLDWLESTNEPNYSVDPAWKAMVQEVYENFCGGDVEQPDDSTVLTSGQPTTGIADKGTYQHYKIYAHAGDTIKVELYNMDANGNLYVKAGSRASVNAYDCKSENGGNTHSKEKDSCSVQADEDGDVYISVHAPSYGCNTNVQHTVKASVNDLNKNYAELGNYKPKSYSKGKGDNKYIAYYPENGIHADMPVVMFIRGSGISIERYKGVMAFLASKGYYVIGVYAGSYQSKYITEKLEIALDDIKKSHGLHISKLSIIGHSLGGGQTFYAMKKFRDDGYGSSGSLVLSIDGWFAFNMNESDINSLNTKISFLQMNGVEGTGTDPRIDLKIWNLATNSDRSFYTLPQDEHRYVVGDLNNVLTKKKDLLLILGALTDDAFKGVSDGKNAIPQSNKASYADIFNTLSDRYDKGDCAGIYGDAAIDIEKNDINYCNL